MKPRQTGCARRWAKLSTSCVQISHPRTLCRKPRRASVCQNSRGGARSISRARAIRARLPSPGLASRCGFWRRLKRNKEGVHEVTLPLRDSSSSLVDTATRVFRERAATKQREFMGAAQTHVAKGAAMLSDAIEDKLEDVIDRVPGGSQVRPLIESTVQVALATALEALLERRPRTSSR